MPERKEAEKTGKKPEDDPPKTVADLRKRAYLWLREMAISENLVLTEIGSGMTYVENLSEQ